MDVDPARLRRGELLAGTGGVLLLVFLVAGTWSGYHGTSRTGWQLLTNLRWLLVATSLAGITLAAVQVARRSPAIPVTLSLLVTVLGLITVVALVYRVFVSPVMHEQAGAILSLICSIGLAYGGYLSLREEGISRRDAPRDIPIVRPGAENRT